jgi:hypothetical protein
MPWFSPTIYSAALYCQLDWRAVSRYGDRVLRIRLEDLLAEPRVVMERVLAFVGEPWDDAVLDHAHHLPGPNLLPPYPWLSSAAEERAAPGVPWRGLAPLDIRLIEVLTRHVMKANGYPRAPLDPEPGKLAVFGAALRQIPPWIRDNVRLGLLGRMLRDPRRFDTPELVAALHRLNPQSWQHYPGFVWPVPPVRALPPAGVKSLP